MTELLVRIINAPRRTRRAIAFGIPAVGILVVGLAVQSALSSVLDARAELLAKRETVGRLKAIAALKDGLLREREAALPSAGSEFLEGETEAVIRGNMQKHLSDVIGAQNANVLSISNVPDLIIDGVRYVGVGADISGTVEAVFHALVSVETSKPLIVRNANMWLSGSVDPNATSPPEISAQLKVYGALRSELGAPEAKAAP
jgi:general secretion pathway protein M